MQLGIAGLGWWGQRLVQAAQGSSGHVRFVAAVVTDPAKRADAAARLGLELTDSFEGLVGRPDLDGIVIATPHSLHESQVALAAAAGKHVFCEKPLALSADAARGAIQACERHGVTLAVGHNRRFAPNVARLIEVARSGELGRLLHVEGHWSNENTTRPDFGAWRHSRDERAGAAMTGTGIHALDIMTCLFGSAHVLRVHQRMPTGALPHAEAETLSVLMEFDGGVSGLLATVRPTPRFWRIHVFGLDGSVEARDDTELRIYRRDVPPHVQQLAAADTLLKELEAFAQACRGGPPYPVTTTDLIDCAGALEDIVAQMTFQDGTVD